MKLQLKKASTDVTLLVFIQDSSQTDGRGLTGLAYDTASLVCYYVRPGSAAAQLALVTQTVTGAHANGGFVEIDATNMPGVYRLDLSDAVVATGVDSVVLMLKGATNTAPVTIEIQLTDFDLNSSAPDVNMVQISGDAPAANNLEAMLDGTGGVDLTLRNVRIAGNSTDAGLWISNEDASGDGIKVTGGAGGQQTRTNIYGTLSTVTTCTTTTTNTDMRGTDSAAPAATALTDATWTDAKAGYIDATITSRATPTDVHGRTVRYVSTGGNDANDGLSWDEAYLTLQVAVTASTDGDLIIIGPGTFSAQTDASAKNKLTFRGAGRGQTILTHNATNTLLVGDAAVLDDMSVRNTQASPPTGEGVAIRAHGADDFVMRRVDIDTDGTGVLLSGSWTGMSEIQGCRITAAEYAISAWGASVATAKLVIDGSILATTGWTVCDTECINAAKVQLIVRNSDVEASVPTSESGHHSWGIYAWYGTKVSIYNSRVYATDGSGSGTYQAGLLVGDTASARAFNSDIRCEGAGSECYDIKNWATNDDLIVSNVEYDADKTDGAITMVGSNVVESTATARQAFADELLKRDVSNVEGLAGADGHTLCTVVLATLESSITDTTWTIKRTDGSTTHATKTVTIDAAAAPITGVA